jgi:hypothetical protein
MTGIWENKGSVVEIKREVIAFRNIEKLMADISQAILTGKTG